MKFALRKWEPKAFKAETQAFTTAVVGLVGYAYDWSVAVIGLAAIVAGYFVGFITVAE